MPLQKLFATLALLLLWPFSGLSHITGHHKQAGFDLSIKSTQSDTVHGCTGLEQILKVWLVNSSNVLVDSFPLTVNIGNQAYRELSRYQLPAGDSVEIELSTKYRADSAGTYTIRIDLDRTDDIGANNTTTITYTIHETPKADFIVDAVCQGEQSLFFNTTQYSGLDSLDYLWNFGDGISSSHRILRHTRHRYALPDKHVTENYLVTLLVLSKHCRDSIAHYTTVHSTSSANFTHEVVHRELRVTPITTEPTDFFEWDLGDGTRSNKRFPKHTYKDDEVYQVCLTVTSAPGCISKSCSMPLELCKVTGRVYADMDSNCFYSAGDQTMRTIVFAQGTQYRSRSQDDGTYELIVPAGRDYVITTAQNRFKAICFSDSFHISNATRDKTYQFDALYWIDSNYHDVGISISSGRVQRGRKTLLTVALETGYWKNSIDSADVLVEFDPRYKIEQVPLVYSSPEPGKIVMRLELPRHHSPKYYTIMLSDDDGKLLGGEEILFSTHLSTIDVDTTDNRDTIKVDVRAPYDPNDKSSYPDGGIKAPVDEIDYTIRFQNIGSADAKDVVIFDRISNHLDANHIKITGSSHPDLLSYQLDHSILKFRFNEIYLPDSTTDPEGSQGFISYRIPVKAPGLRKGDTIKNMATIYFDFEEGIETNTTKLFIVDENTSIAAYQPKKIGFTVYPNPTDGLTHINNNQSESLEFKLLDIRGATLTTFTVDPHQSKVIHLDHLASGIYVLRSSDGNALNLIRD